MSGDALDPDIRRFVAEVSAGWAHYGDLGAASPAEARRIAEQVRAPWTHGGPQMATITERVVSTAHGDVRVRLYDPGPPATKPALIYLHGGGWTLFSLDTHDRLMREYAARAGVIVAGVDYALSPESRFPVALEQVVAVARFLAGGGAGPGIDPLRIAIGGDSAGANLAIAACIRLRNEGRADLIRAMVLNYGVFARRSSSDAQRRFGGAGNMLTADEMEGFWKNYLRDDRDAEDPLVCPVRAELQNLPPAFLAAAGRDLLAEQSVEMADRLNAARVPVRLEIYRGASHSFLEAVSISPLADRAFDDASIWLRAALS